MTEEIEIRIPGRPRHLAMVRAFLRAMVRNNPQVPLAPRDGADLQLVVQEACINAMRHGSVRGPGEHVRIVFRLDPDGLTIDVYDRGPGFDLSEIPEPDAEALQEGGYGVWIIKKAMDRVETRRTPDGFVLSMTKLFTPKPETAVATPAAE